ncbi:MAG: M42 family metallopeptidase [Clostridia bacterium]|nr:M42 family metallopeptidase [Clostridia bacterium]
MEQNILDYTLEELKNILAIDSPTGFTAKVAEYLCEAFTKLGIPAHKTAKGGVLADLTKFAAEDADPENGVLLSAHIDTLGAMVKEVKGNGRLKVRPMGGLNANNTETELVRVYTRDGKYYEGNLQFCDASLHVNGNAISAARNWDNVEVVLDEIVNNAAETKALGIENGCYVCVDPRTVITPSGYIKSRYLDDKLSAAILLGFAKHLADSGEKTLRPIYMHFTVYEEVGHGAGGICPKGVTEIFGVDMGCVGDGLECTEQMVSICASDGSGPYNYEINCQLVKKAKKHNLGYAVDIYPLYSSDCSVSVREYDLRHALIGAGVYASHGYERSHIDGVKNTFELIRAYLCEADD